MYMMPSRARMEVGGWKANARRGGCGMIAAGNRGKVECNLYQRTVDYPDLLANGFDVMLPAVATSSVNKIYRPSLQ